MATVTLYNNKSDTIVVQKDITKIIDTEAEFLDTLDITQPTIILNTDGAFIDCNYAYIKEFKRYYYVNAITVLDGYRLVLKLSVDVLMSFQAYILNSSQHIIRQEQLYNLHIKDSETPVLHGTFIQYKNPDNIYFNFSNEDDEESYNYVLNAL